MTQKLSADEIKTGLTQIAASENMNQRQRDIMTEAAGFIKYQEYCVQTAITRQLEAEGKYAEVSTANDDLKAKIASLTAIVGYWRKNLEGLAKMEIANADE